MTIPDTGCVKKVHDFLINRPDTFFSRSFVAKTLNFKEGTIRYALSILRGDQDVNQHLAERISNEDRFVCWLSDPPIEVC